MTSDSGLLYLMDIVWGKGRGNTGAEPQKSESSYRCPPQFASGCPICSVKMAKEAAASAKAEDLVAAD